MAHFKIRKWVFGARFVPVLILVSGLLGLHGGNTSDGREIGSESLVIVQKEDHGKEITVRVGDTVQVELVQLGSAGYKWHLSLSDPSCLELVSSETREISEGRVGGPVLGIWKFKAKKEGATEVRMDHYRPWEGADRSTDRFLIRLIIR